MLYSSFYSKTLLPVEDPCEIENWRAPGRLIYAPNCNNTWRLIGILILEIFFLFNITCSPTELKFMTRQWQTVRQLFMSLHHDFVYLLSVFLFEKKRELEMVTWKYDHRKYYVDKVCDHLKLILLLVHNLSHIIKFVIFVGANSI